MRVTVIIPTFRGRPWIRACLESLQADRGIAPRVVVFDNASTDGTREIVEKEFPRVELVHSDRNLGFAEANNRIMRECIERDEDFVFLLNDDTRVEPWTLSNLVRVAEERDVALLCPLQFDYEGRAFEDDFARMLARHDLPADWRVRDFIVTRRLIGAAMLCRVSVLKRIGLFDPIYFFYGEEDDLCRRATFHGYRVGIAPQTRIFHGHKGTERFEDLPPVKRLNMFRAKYIFALKDPDRPMARTLPSCAAQVVRDVARVLRTHNAGVAADFLCALKQVAGSLGRIRRRRRAEMELSDELWNA